MSGRSALLRRRTQAPDELATPARDGDGPDGPRRRRRAVPLAIGLAGAGAALATVLIASGGDEEPTRAAGAEHGDGRGRAPHTRRRELVDGTLGYAGTPHGDQPAGGRRFVRRGRRRHGFRGR